VTSTACAPDGSRDRTSVKETAQAGGRAEPTPARPRGAELRSQAHLSPVGEFCAAALVLACGATTCYTYRHMITSDGVSYADLADRYAAGRWSETVNGHWSRLYPFLLSIPLRLLHPTRYTENLYFHAVNMVLFAAALVSFHFLLREIIEWQRIESSKLSTISWTPKQFTLAGYALFAYILRMVSPGYITPDIGVVAVSILATAILVRMTRISDKRWPAAMLGLLLGVGYLMKSILMVFSVGCLAALCLIYRGRKRVQTVAIVAAGLIVVSAPNIIQLSKREGRLTFSESGRLVEMWQADGTSFVDLDPRGDVAGIAKHPPRQIFSHPNAYEFATPIVATYPPWFDPAYWHQGLSPKFDPKGEAYALRVTGTYYLHALLVRKAPLLILLSCLLILQQRSQVPYRWRWAFWLVPCLLPLAAYAALFADDRYIGGFLLLAVVVTLGSIQLPDTPFMERAFSRVALWLTLVLALFVAFSTIREAMQPPRDVAGEVAEGIRQGHYFATNDAVACIGYCFDHYWARMDHLHLVAEVPGQVLAVNAAKGPLQTGIVTDADVFWSADNRTKEQVLTALEKAGAKGVVAITPPANADKTGWKQIGDTNYYVKTFRR
jgi:hypothetical protein